MPGAITLRPIADEDRGFLRALYGTTRADELAVVDWSEEQKAEFIRFQFRAQHTYYMQQFPNAAFDLVLEDDRPIGRFYVDRRADEIRVIDIAILPEKRRSGIGGRLMRQILEEGQDAGLPVQIHVERNNPALALYRRLGFEEIEDQQVYLLMKWQPNLGRTAQ
jgi:ribosomal protein S18 acetylase RimI-like enzyme